MKFRTLVGGSFDHSAKVLTLTGTNIFGKSARVDLPIENVSAFVSEIIAVLLNDPAAPGSAIMIDNVTVAAQDTPGIGFTATFRFDLGDGLSLSFGVPLATRSSARLAAVQAHLREALSQMSQPDDPPSH